MIESTVQVGSRMPKDGYRAITVPEKLAKILKEKALRANRSVPKEIEHLVRAKYPNQESVKCRCETPISSEKSENVECRSCGVSVE